MPTTRRSSNRVSDGTGAVNVDTQFEFKVAGGQITSQPRQNFLDSDKSLLKVESLSKFAKILDDGTLVDFYFRRIYEQLIIRQSHSKNGKVNIFRRWYLRHQVHFQKSRHQIFLVSSDLQYCVLLHLHKPCQTSQDATANLLMSVFHLSRNPIRAGSTICASEHFKNLETIQGKFVTPTLENPDEEAPFVASLSNNNTLCLLINQEDSLADNQKVLIYEVVADDTGATINHTRDLIVSGLCCNVSALKFDDSTNKIILEKDYIFFVYPIQTVYKSQSPTFQGLFPYLTQSGANDEFLIFEHEGEIEIHLVSTTIQRNGCMVLEYTFLYNISNMNITGQLYCQESYYGYPREIVDVRSFRHTLVCFRCVHKLCKRVHILNVQQKKILHCPEVHSFYRDYNDYNLNWSCQELYLKTNKDCYWNHPFPTASIEILSLVDKSKTENLQDTCVKSILNHFSLNYLRSQPLPKIIKKKLCLI